VWGREERVLGRKEEVIGDSSIEKALDINWETENKRGRNSQTRTD
jgi:hypothetical protein